MKINIVSKQVPVTDGLRSYVEKKVPRIQKYFDDPDSVLDITVTFSVQKNTQTVEVLVHTKGLYLKGVDKSEDMYASLDKAIDKIEKQVARYKDRIKTRKYNGAAQKALRMNVYEAASMEASTPEIMISKEIAGDHMNVEEAAMQMELLDKPFFAFRNDQGLLSVVYKRDDGNIGLIEA